MYRLKLHDGGEPVRVIASGLPSIAEAQRVAEAQAGGPLHWPTNTHGESPSASYMGEYIIEEDSMTEVQQPEVQQPDIQTLIQSQIQEQLSQLMAAPAQSFEEALADVNPADSEAALAMLDFLLKTGRLNRVGVLDGGAGYLFVYQEPKGSTKQGYTPGATQGDRIVDEAVEAQRAAGRKPVKQGMCVHCFSVVSLHPEGVIVLDEPDGTDGATCSNSPDGKHEMA